MKIIRVSSKIIMAVLITLTLLLISFSISTPKPVHADVRIPCYGYVCIDARDDWRVAACIATEEGNAWFCRNYCLHGTWYCAGEYGCRVGC